MIVLQYLPIILIMVSIQSTVQMQHLIETVNNFKNILYWTPMFQRRDFYLGLGANIFSNCSYKNCLATYNKSYIPIDQFDAILFHAFEYTEARFGKPEKRTAQQIYIMGNCEPPTMTRPSVKYLDDFYNWTMSYRSDSDVLRSYGTLIKRKTYYEAPSSAEIEARPGKVAWFSSHCTTPGRREVIVLELQRYFPVDVYGECGNLSCSTKKREECYNMMERNYKFYLSFENSVCDDYATEKLYNVLKRDVVPVVYGGADYNKIAPPGSVINVMDYKSVKDLVDYIRHLDVYTEDYLKFFRWKRDYIVDTSNRGTLCALCRRLNTESKMKVYKNMTLWWQGKNGDKCSNTFIKDFL